jgi:hypothetical protein
MRFEIINNIPRIILNYKIKSTLDLVVQKDFIFPVRFRSLITQIKEIGLSRSIQDRDELGFIMSYKSIPAEQKKVLAVGVGSGISLMYNLSKFNNKPRFFTIVEASKLQIEIAKKNIKLNNLTNENYIFVEGYLATNSTAYGSKRYYSNNCVNLLDFDFDILELDCEGSEIEILTDLNFFPKTIIVEMHPHLVNINFEEFNLFLVGKGYEMTFSYTVFGESINKSEVSDYFSDSRIRKLKSANGDWGNNLVILTFQKMNKKVDN